MKFDRRSKRSLKRIVFFSFMLAFSGFWFFAAKNISAAGEGPIMIMDIDGPISPATDDYLKTSLKTAEEKDARLLIIRLNTPGGLLQSMKTMVESLLKAKVPTAVYVTPSGGGAISAGVFITLAGNFAVMAPGTNIGAAHPVQGGGQDVQGDMRAKVENFTVSLIQAIAEQRGRNVAWAEKAVRESIAVTDREALKEGVIDFVASDLERLLEELEGKTTNVAGTPVTLSGLKDAPQETLSMTWKQAILNILCDPNIALLFGIGAMLGLGIELYSPGAIFPGVIGVICLVLSLTAAQVLPIRIGGVVLLLLSGGFFILEFVMPSFGIWGVAGTICLVLGSIYFIDTDLVWSSEGFAVDKMFIGSTAGIVGLILLAVCLAVVKSSQEKYKTGREGLLGEVATVKTKFEIGADGKAYGKVFVMGELWNAILEGNITDLPNIGEQVSVKKVGSGMTLTVSKP